MLHVCSVHSLCKKGARMYVSLAFYMLDKCSSSAYIDGINEHQFCNIIFY